MKLVMCWTTPDGFEVSLPFEYESAERALLDFSNERVFAEVHGKYEFQFVGYHFYPGDMVGCDLEIMTLDEWFEYNRIDKYTPY